MIKDNSNHPSDWIEIWFKVHKRSDGYPQTVDWEGLWGEPIAPREYAIRSIPFYVDDVSMGDLVTVKHSADATHAFEKVLSRSGHDTLRILLSDDTEKDLAKVISRLEELGACTETEIGCFIAIDVSPKTRMAVRQFVRDGFEKGLWDVDDGFVSDSIGDAH